MTQKSLILQQNNQVPMSLGKSVTQPLELRNLYRSVYVKLPITKMTMRLFF